MALIGGGEETFRAFPLQRPTPQEKGSCQSAIMKPYIAGERGILLPLASSSFSFYLKEWEKHSQWGQVFKETDGECYCQGREWGAGQKRATVLGDILKHLQRLHLDLWSNKWLRFNWKVKELPISNSFRIPSARFQNKKQSIESIRTIDTESLRSTWERPRAKRKD